MEAVSLVLGGHPSECFLPRAEGSHKGQVVRSVPNLATLLKHWFLIVGSVGSRLANTSWISC